MLWEAIASGVIGLALLWFVLTPALRPRQPKLRPVEPAELEETPRGAALAALREIEFDRETGKLSDTDYASLKATYTAEAIAALRADAHACRVCGPRPEPDAAFCSECGSRLETGRVCARCGSALPPDSSFCEACGARVAA